VWCKLLRGFFLVLSDRDIRLHLASGKIRITPPIDFDTQLGSCSVDFRLGTKFRVFEHSSHSIRSDEPEALTDAIVGFLVYRHR